MSRWFRMYDEILDDPKVQMLTPEDFKIWINLLALASRNNGKLPPFHETAFALRMCENAVRTVAERLLNAGLIDKLNGGHDGCHYTPHRWEERQYKSDRSTERVKRFRKRSKPNNETPPETETETDIPLSKDNGATPDSDKVFWDGAKGFLQSESRNPGAVIGKWVRDRGKAATAEAITRAQLERPVQRIPFIEGVLRRSKNCDEDKHYAPRMLSPC